MGLRELLAKLRRERDQLTVELAEEGVAPEGEVEATEERIAEHRHESTEDKPD
jgi:hypothetical protein